MFTLNQKIKTDKVMKQISKTLLATTLMAAASLAQAGISDDKVKIGVITDMSGPYADPCGPGCTEAVKMAVEDFGGQVLGKPIEVVSADDQNKPDVGSLVARRWIENEQVDAITGLTSSAVTGAIAKIVTDNEKIALISGAASHAFTTKACSPFIAHWTYDLIALANGVVKPMMDSGKKRWYFITADYAAGHALEKVAGGIVTANGGEVLGSVRAPLGTTDFASYVLQAQASGADVVALANAGTDMVNALKAASEFGLTQQMDVAGLLVFAPSVQALDPAIAAGMKLTTAFYWDLDDQTRSWSQRYMQRMGGKIPAMPQAGAYSATMHYLNAIVAAGTDEAKAVMAKMKSTPVEDFFPVMASCVLTDAWSTICCSCGSRTLVSAKAPMTSSQWKR
tara:strand:+ start:4738 stop:5922 length:1185 start_codon:yes stop_codon:yes gene_type:complete